MSATYFDRQTGRILYRSRSGNMGVDDAVDRIPGFFDPAAYYVEDGAAVEQAELNYTLDKPLIDADGVDVATVSGLPEGAVVYYGSAEYTTTNGTFTFSAISPGVYVFTLNEVAYVTTEIKIEAQ